MKFNVGIIGGGQLSRMLAEAGEKLGLTVHALTSNPKDPVAHTTAQLHLGEISDTATSENFFKSCDLVTFENEFIDIGAVKKLASRSPVKLAPSLEVIESLQDKLQQKRILVSLGIPTSDFLVFEDGEKISTWLTKVRLHFKNGFVLKWSRFGYDGKGVWISDVTSGDPESFVQKALDRRIAVYAEEKIRFINELAIIACRSGRGDFVSYPLVISKQSEGICHWVEGPASVRGLSKIFEERARHISQKLADHIKIEGTFAIEFFQSENSELIVNEIAPRVHNSGHYSLTAAKTSQFENHWQGVLATLSPATGIVETKPYFAMLNLVGPKDLPTIYDHPSLLPKTPHHTELYWYDKTEIRAGRKVGHLNGYAQSELAFEKLLHEMRSFEAQWVQRLKQEEAHGH
jgi:5-(carboxyamino)imidazole ribonucleotide synthase